VTRARIVTICRSIRKKNKSVFFLHRKPPPPPYERFSTGGGGGAYLINFRFYAARRQHRV